MIKICENHYQVTIISYTEELAAIIIQYIYRKKPLPHHIKKTFEEIKFIWFSIQEDNNLKLFYTSKEEYWAEYRQNGNQIKI